MECSWEPGHANDRDKEGCALSWASWHAEQYGQPGTNLLKSGKVKRSWEAGQASNEGKDDCAGSRASWHSDALALVEACRRLRNKVLGPDHPHTRVSFYALNNWKDQHKSVAKWNPSTLKYSNRAIRISAGGYSMAQCGFDDGSVTEWDYLNLPHTQGRVGGRILSRRSPPCHSFQSTLPCAWEPRLTWRWLMQRRHSLRSKQQAIDPLNHRNIANPCSML